MDAHAPVECVGWDMSSGCHTPVGPTYTLPAAKNLKLWVTTRQCGWAGVGVTMGPL